MFEHIGIEILADRLKQWKIEKKFFFSFLRNNLQMTMTAICFSALRFWLCLLGRNTLGQSYSDTVNIMVDIVENKDYHTEVRPLKDQLQVIDVDVDFELVSIVNIDDVAQSFNVNGFLLFTWQDEVFPVIREI